MHSVALFDDGRGLLSPLTDLRPVFDVRTGAMTTLERAVFHARATGGVAPTHLFVPEDMAALARERHTLPVNEYSTLGETVTMLNGAAVFAASHVGVLDAGTAIVDATAKTVVAATIGRSHVDHVLRHEVTGLKVVVAERDEVISRPWHLRKHRDEAIKRDLHGMMAAAMGMGEGESSQHEFRAHVATSARVHPSVICDTERGHVFIDAYAVVRPGAILVGPVYIGEHSTVLERSLIKGNTAIGRHCKVAGEIGGTIFQGYANKAHEGHLGDSWVGEWANLGAGTTNSNLLNTYGDVVCRPLGADGKPGSNERTGEQFLGATIGDHVKMAICTRIMTGAIVGTGTMFAASGPLSGTVPALSWITDSGTKWFAVEKFVDIARTVMARRRIECGEAYVTRLRALSGIAER